MVYRINTSARKNYLSVEIIKKIPHPDDFDEFVKTYSRFGCISKRSLEQYMIFAEGVTYAMRNTPRLLKDRLETLEKFYAKVNLAFEITYKSPTNYSWDRVKKFSSPQEVSQWVLDTNLENVHLLVELYQDFDLDKGSDSNLSLASVFYKVVRYVETAQLENKNAWANR